MRNVAEIDDVLFGTPQISPMFYGESGQSDYDDIVEHYSKHYGIDPSLIKNMIQQESGGDVDAESYVGASGIMQIMPDTWEDIVGQGKMETYWPLEDIEDPVKNREVGTYYMNIEIPRLLNHYGLPDTIYTRLAAYNWGIGHLLDAVERHEDNWVNNVPEETSNYFRKYGLF